MSVYFVTNHLVKQNSFWQGCKFALTVALLRSDPLQQFARIQSITCHVKLKMSAVNGSKQRVSDTYLNHSPNESPNHEIIFRNIQYSI